MLSQVITIERRKYAAGLFWQPVPDGQNARVFARGLAKLVPGRIKYFTEYRSMVGVGSRALGHTGRMPSAAAEVMEGFADYNSFVAAFAVRQGFWLVAARNGIIIQDKLYADEADAKSEFEALAVLPDWGIMVAPGYWSAPRSEEKHIGEIVSGDARYSIQAVSHFGRRLLIAAAIAALLAAGFYAFRTPVMNAFRPKERAAKPDARAIEEYKKKLEAKDNILVSREKAKPVSVEMPYDALPDAFERAEQCHQAISFLMQIVPGWSQVDAECGETFASAHLHRRFGSVLDVYDFVALNMPGVEIIENSDSDVVLNMQLERLPTRSGLEESGGEEVARAVNSVFQMMNAPVSVRQSVETVKGSLTDGRIAGANVVLVSAASAMQPAEFMKIFADYDAVSLPSVRWSARDRKWNYEVKIYVKQ